MSTTDEALKKELWAAIYESRDLNGHGQAPTSAVVAAVLPVVRKAERDAAREALDSYIEYDVKHAQKWSTPTDVGYFRDTHYPEDVTP